MKANQATLGISPASRPPTPFAPRVMAPKCGNVNIMRIQCDNLQSGLMSRPGLEVRTEVLAVQVTLHHSQISALTNGLICHDNNGSKQTKVLQAVRLELSLLIRLNVREKKNQKNKKRKCSLKTPGLGCPITLSCLCSLNHNRQKGRSKNFIETLSLSLLSIVALRRKEQAH